MFKVTRPAPVIEESLILPLTRISLAHKCEGQALQSPSRTAPRLASCYYNTPNLPMSGRKVRLKPSYLLLSAGLIQTCTFAKLKKRMGGPRHPLRLVVRRVSAGRAVVVSVGRHGASIPTLHSFVLPAHGACVIASVVIVPRSARRVSTVFVAVSAASVVSTVVPTVTRARTGARTTAGGPRRYESSRRRSAPYSKPR